MVDKLILNQSENKNQTTFQEVWISAISFAVYNTIISNSKTLKNENLFKKNKLGILLKNILESQFFNIGKNQKKAETTVLGK